MILELNGTKVTIVDKTLGYQGDNFVDTIQVTVDKDSTWNYKLDMYKGKSKCFDSVLMTREGNVCTVQLTNEILSYGGRYVFQLRGYTDTQTYHSDIFESWVNASIEYQDDCKQGDCECDCKLPTEFYQVEDNVTEINNHPPYPGDNNKWMIWDVNKHEYVESDIEVIGGGGGDYQTKDNLTTSITAESTDEQYPSAKATYDAIQNASVVTVKITGSGTDSDPYVSSMTYDEIKSHMQAGKTVVAVGGEMSGNGFYVASHIWSTRIDFARMVNVTYSNVMARFCSVYTDGIVDYTGFNLETTLHKVTSLSADSTDAKYPSAKAVYDAIQAAKPDIVTPTAESTDTQAASAKAVWDMIGTGSSGTDISLGVTGASVGDIIKVKQVDADGKPTEWDSYSDQFELLRTITITESTNAVSITQDENGDTFSLSDVFIYCDSKIGQGLNYATITYTDNNNLVLAVGNALNDARVTQIVAKNDGGFYRSDGLWAASDNEKHGAWYRLVTAKSFEPISSVILSFGTAVTKGRIRMWGIRA